VVEQSPDEVDDRGLGDADRGGGVAADGGADDGEDARADDNANSEGGERNRAEGFFEGVLGTLGVGDELVDALSSEDLAGQGSFSDGWIYWIVTIVSGNPGKRAKTERKDREEETRGAAKENGPQGAGSASVGVGWKLALGLAAAGFLDLGLVFAASSSAGSLGWGGFAGGALDLLALDFVGNCGGVCHDVFSL
jgi:hypothetical protein